MMELAAARIAAAAAVLILSFVATIEASSSRIGGTHHTSTQTTTLGHHRQIQEVPAACIGLNENKIQDCIDEQALIQSILTQYNLDNTPSQCEGMNVNKLGACLEEQQLIGSLLSQYELDNTPSQCEGMNVDKLGDCLEENKLISTMVSQYGLDGIPSACTGMNAAKLGECLAERQSILEMNGVTDVPSMCEGLQVGKLDACIVNHVTVQTILDSNKIQDIPLDCAEEDSDKLVECLQEWRLTQIILGLSPERIPPECVDMEKENDLAKCLEEYTLAPTNMPTYHPTLVPTTYRPTVYFTYSPTKSPIDWTSFNTQLQAQIAAEASDEELEAMFTATLDTQVSLPIGRYGMSLTRYNQKKKTDRNREQLDRVLKKGAYYNGEHPRQAELEATRKHLKEVYEADFGIPVFRVDLHFVDGGDTALGMESPRNMRHSTFFGNVIFEKDQIESEDEVPTQEQLENATLSAFEGDAKQAFIEEYHYEATGRQYFGIKYTYDVNVRRLSDVVDTPGMFTEGASDSTPAASASNQKGNGLTLSALGERLHQWSSSSPSTVFTGLFVVAGVLLGLVIGLTAVVVGRKRRRNDNGPKTPSSRETHIGPFIDDEPDVLGSVMDPEEIENGISEDEMIYSCVQSSSLQSQSLSKAHSFRRVQSSIPTISTDDFEDCVSHLATSSDDSVVVAKGIAKEVGSNDSTKEVDSGDSDSTLSYADVKSTGSGSGSEKVEPDVEHQLT